MSTCLKDTEISYILTQSGSFTWASRTQVHYCYLPGYIFTGSWTLQWNWDSKLGPLKMRCGCPQWLFDHCFKCLSQ